MRIVNMMSFSLKGLMMFVLFTLFGLSVLAEDGFVRTDHCCIVAMYGGKYYAMKTTGSTTGKLDAVNVAVVNGKVYCTDEVAESIAWLREDVGEESCFKKYGESKYLYWNSSNKANISLNGSKNKYMVDGEGSICLSESYVRYIAYYYKTTSSYFGAYEEEYTGTVFAKVLPFASASEMTYTRTGLSSGMLGTICLPLDVSSTNGCGANFYKVAGLKGSYETPESIVFERVEELEAGKPYVFVAEGESFSVDMSGDVVCEGANVNGLVGMLADGSVTEGKYVISGNRIQKCGSGCTISANRAYMRIESSAMSLYDEGSSSGKMVMELGVGDVSTGVACVGNCDIVGDGMLYNMLGQRVMRAGRSVRGIVIENGRKRVVR